MPEISSLGVFFRDKGIFVFLLGEGGCHACNAYVYIQKIPYFHAFYDKIIFFHFLPKAKISYFLEKINIVFRHKFPGKTIFPEHLKKISYFQFFFFFLRKIIFHFVSKIRSYFREKEISSFLIIQEIYSSAIFFGKTMFSKRLEKENMVFRAVRYELLCAYL